MLNNFKNKENSTKTERHFAIFLKLIEQSLSNNNEGLNPKELADYFGVVQRTIRRDILELQGLRGLINVNEKGYWHLHPDYLERIENAMKEKILQQVDKFNGTEILYPQGRLHFLIDQLDVENPSFQAKNPLHEFQRPQWAVFRQLDEAIQSHRYIECVYKDKKRELAAYRVLYFEGVWYVMATEEKKIKSFVVSNLKNVELLENKKFNPDISLQRDIDQAEDIWFGENQFEVILEINSKIASYFKQRKLLPHQNIQSTQKDGSLLVSTQARHALQILPRIKRWLPHIQIKEPLWLQNELAEELKKYLNYPSSF